VVTIKKYDDMFIFKDTDRNVSYPISKTGLKEFIKEDQDELVISKQGGRRIYNIDNELKGIDKPVGNTECEM